VSETTVATAILQTLAGAGVQTAFGLPGVHNLGFWEAEGGDVPEIVGTRHEQTTVYAADGMARAGGGLGVSLTTTGPGVANAAGAFGEAAVSGSPVLLVSSDTSTRIARPGVVRGGLHESSNQGAIFAGLAKEVHQPRTAAEAVDAVARGAEAAMQWPRGPVYVGVPTDILGQPGEPLAIAQPQRPEPADADLRAALKLIGAAGSIVLWVGGGAVQSEAADEVNRLAARLGAPVVATWAGRGVVAAGSPWLVDLPPHEPEVTNLIADADLMIAIGTGFDGPNTMNWALPLPDQLIAINADPVDVSKNYPPAVALVADARETVRALADAVAPREGDPSTVRELCDRVRARIGGDAETEAAWEFVAAIDRAVVRRDPVLVNDMAISGYWVGGYARLARPRRMQYPVGWGTLGYALPAAVGAGALRDRPVLAICGDGGFMFAVGELAVVREHDLAVTVLLVDDGGYGMLRFDQTAAGKANRGVDLMRPDFAMLARSFGIECRATDLSGLGDALDEALGAGVPRMVLLEQELYPPVSVSARWPR
jgi:thiamine pyrophosphate-dependent acetolactate synthase large subunit-like protein